MSAMAHALHHHGGNAESSAWGAVARAASSVPLVAIVNPNSGPGEGKDPNYESGVKMLKIAGVKVRMRVFRGKGRGGGGGGGGRVGGGKEKV